MVAHICNSSFEEAEQKDGELEASFQQNKILPVSKPKHKQRIKDTKKGKGKKQTVPESLEERGLSCGGWRDGPAVKSVLLL